MKDQEKPNPKDFITNLSQPIPFGKKISLLLRNNALKIINRTRCCGHPGEPGC